MWFLDDIGDSGFDGADDDEMYGYGYYQRRRPTCVRCGKKGLHWLNDGRGWYLGEGSGYAHECAEPALHKKAADDFEDLDK